MGRDLNNHADDGAHAMLNQLTSAARLVKAGEWDESGSPPACIGIPTLKRSDCAVT